MNNTGAQGLEGLVNRDLGYDRAGNRLADTISGNGSFIRNVITENDKYRFYSDPNGFGNIVQKTNKLNGEIHIYDYLTDGKIRKFTKYEKIPNSTQTMAVDYFYDALGRRVAKKVKTPSREFTQTFSYLANEDKILFAKKGNNEVQMEIDGQGIDEHLGEITIAGIKTFTSDHLGTVVNGEVVMGKKTTGAFGETLSSLNLIETTSNPTLYGYTGRQLDQESGFYYYRNRYYDSQSGRFLSKDPSGIGGGDVNLYRYIRNSPVSTTDPLGLIPLPNDIGASPLNTHEGTEMLVNSYMNSASQNVSAAWDISVNNRNMGTATGDSAASAEHYLYARSEVASGGTSPLVMGAQAVGYQLMKGTFPQAFGNASPASSSQALWGAKGVADGLVCP